MKAALFLCYVLYPASMLLGRAAGIPIWRNWIDAAWIVLAVAAMTTTMGPASRYFFEKTDSTASNRAQGRTSQPASGRSPFNATASFSVFPAREAPCPSRPCAISGLPASGMASSGLSALGLSASGLPALGMGTASLSTIGLTICFLTLLVILRFGIQWIDQPVQSLQLIPWLMELKPLFYGLVTLTIWDRQLLVRSDIIRFGAWLGSMLLLDCAVSSLLAGAIVRPQGSGEINYDALLLLFALCQALPALMRSAGCGPDQPNRLQVLLCTAGLFVTFSRTAYAALAVILLFSSSSLPRKALLVLLCLFGLAVSFAVRDLQADSLTTMDRYWMWSSALELWLSQPTSLLSGFAPGLALPVSVPSALQELWNMQGRAWSVDGIFAYNYHSFWIRNTMTWGVFSTIVFLAYISRLAFGANDQSIRFVALSTIIFSLTMGVFYLGNVAIPSYLFLLYGTQSVCRFSRPDRATRASAVYITHQHPE